MILVIENNLIREMKEWELDPTLIKSVYEGSIKVVRVFHGKFWYLGWSSQNRLMMWHPLNPQQGDRPKKVDRNAPSWER